MIQDGCSSRILNMLRACPCLPVPTAPRFLGLGSLQPFDRQCVQQVENELQAKLRGVRYMFLARS